MTQTEPSSPDAGLVITESFHDAILYIKSDSNAFRERLEELFRVACDEATSLNKQSASTMSIAKFRTLLQDFGLIDQMLTIRDAELIYVSVTGTQDAMNQSQFFIALYECAVRKMKGKQNLETTSKIAAFEKFVGQILSNDTILPMYLNSSPTASFFDDYSFEKILWTYEKILHKIFDMYSEIYVTEDDFDRLQVIKIQSFMSFAKKFNICPNEISHIDVTRFFKMTDKKAKDNDQQMYLTFFDFADCILRMGIYIFSKPHFNKMYQTPQEKVVAFLMSFSDCYVKMLDSKMEDDLVNLKEIGIPVLDRLEPNTGCHAGGNEVKLFGSNYDARLGGVWVQFGNLSISIPRDNVRPNCLTFSVPPRKESINYEHKPEIHLELDSTDVEHCYVAKVSLKSFVYVNACNNFEQKAFSDTGLQYHYIDHLPVFEVAAEISQGLENVFKKYCRFNDPYNSTHLTLEKFKLFKYDHKHEFKFSNLTQSDREAPEFHKYASNDKNGLRLVFVSFLKAVLYLAMTKKQDMHPIDFLVGIVRRNEKKTSEVKAQLYGLDESEESQVASIQQSVISRTARAFDVYSGPVLVALIEEKPGWIVTADDKRISKHNCINFKQYDECCGQSLISHIQVCENFNHLLIRIMRAGFDLAAASNPATRTLSGRCWHIVNERKEKVACIWDYPGQFSSITWQPRIGEKENPEITMTIYDWTNGTEDADQITKSAQDFLNFHKIFTDSKSIGEARTLIEKSGYKLLTKLYKIM